MKFAEGITAPLFNGNGWANTSLIQSEPFYSFSLLEECQSDMMCTPNALTMSFPVVTIFHTKAAIIPTLTKVYRVTTPCIRLAKPYSNM